MNIQIRSIILYKADGRKRVLPFKLGSVNIITGQSKTGKSAIIPIVEYCLGRSSFNIPEGVIRENVAWYAILYQIGNNQVLVAKPVPPARAIQLSEAYYEVSKEISLPALSKLIPNSNDDAITENLSRLIGISPNRNIPDARESRASDALEANIKHSRLYCFQEQSLIAHKDILFHRQQDQFMPQAIKDTLPYFLGATREDMLMLVNELRRVRRALKLKRNELAEAESIVSERTQNGTKLIEEAKQVGLISPEFSPANVDHVLKALKSAVEWNSASPLPVGDDRLPQLRQELAELRSKLRQKREKLELVDSYAKIANGYSNEVDQQSMRLQSINLFDPQNDCKDVCPLCSSEMTRPIATISAMQRALKNLNDHLQTVQIERPRLHEYTQALEDDCDEIKQQITEKQSIVDAVVAEEKAAQHIQDINARIARVVGRISLYLENVQLVDELSPLRRQIEELEGRVKRYEDLLDPSEIADNMDSILNMVGAQMTEMSKELHLEHEGLYRLNPDKLTVVVDQSERMIPMERMGSGENWLGCHLIAHLALHKHFIIHKRPVPSFLILDQPSQVYFPSTVYQAMKGTIEESMRDDADTEAMRRMFDLLFRICEELQPNLQIIVMEHANLDDRRFQNALVEDPWRDGRALIPQNWLIS